MEKKAPNEMEVAAQKDEEREKVKKAAQGWVKIFYYKYANYINNSTCLFLVVV